MLSTIHSTERSTALRHTVLYCTGEQGAANCVGRHAYSDNTIMRLHDAAYHRPEHCDETKRTANGVRQEMRRALY